MAQATELRKQHPVTGGLDHQFVEAHGRPGEGIRVGGRLFASGKAVTHAVDMPR